MTIGERAYKAISDHANQKGAGIVEYAKSIGISQPNLSNWERARSEPRAYLLSILAEAGLDAHWILTGQEDGKVAVVRCKECKDARKEIALDNREYFMCKHTETCHSGSHFCSYGERRDRDETD